MRMIHRIILKTIYVILIKSTIFIFRPNGHRQLSQMRSSTKWGRIVSFFKSKGCVGDE